MEEKKTDILLKTELEDLKIEFDCVPALTNVITDKRELINSRIDELDGKLSEVHAKIDNLNKEIERLTYNGDTGDLILAVGSGVLSGMLDKVFVGELGLFKGAGDEAKEKFEKDLGSTHESLNKFILKYARKKGYKGDRLDGAISFLEKKYSVAQDNVWKGKQISSAKTHHLDDLAHHPSILGLISAIAVQYLRISDFASKDGSVHFVFVKPTKDDLIKIVVPLLFSGLIFWLVNLAEKGFVEFDEDLPKPIRMIVENLHKAPIALSILKTTSNWSGHLVSDMGGSKNTAGGGAGIPGIFLSFLKEISMLPGIQDSNLPKVLNDLYLNKKNSPLTHKLDLRTELAVVEEQSMPIIANEVIVRTGYFVRHLIIETKDKELKDVEWLRVVPLYNRTIVRMMTVATGAFTAVDLADAAVETAAKHHEACASVPSFLGVMAMRVNFVGLGRLAIAVTTDAAMGIKVGRDEKERAIMMQNMALLTEAKMYYRLADSQLEMANLFNAEKDMHEAEAEMWKQVEQTEESYQELYKVAAKVGEYYAETILKMNETFEAIEEDVEGTEESDPEFLDGMRRRFRIKRGE